MKPVKALERIEDLVPDAVNANKGTDRGGEMLAHSLKRYGVGRPILADRNGRIIGGNKTLQRAIERGIVQIEVVRTRGDKLVVHQREDLDLDDPDNADARELAIADNRVAEVDLDWDAKMMDALHERDTDMTAFFTDDELASIFAPEGKRKKKVSFSAKERRCTCCRRKCKKGCGCYEED